MLKDRIVCVKLKKRYKEQRPLSYIGKVTSMTNDWLVVDAKGLMLCRSESSGVQVDKRTAAMVFPTENIESVRVLPDSFDMANIRITTEGQQLRVVVDGAMDCFVGEMGEG